MTLIRKREIFSYKWEEVVSVEELIKLAESGTEALKLELEDGDLLGLSSEDINLFCENASSMAAVKALCFINCGMTLEDFQLVFEALPKMRNLEYLDVSSNPLETEGSKLLSEYLRKDSLKHLAISNCNISSTGLSYIVDELENANSIRSLIVDNNPDLSTNAILSLYDAVKKRKNIVQFSTLNTYCDVKSMSDVFKIVKKHLNILFIGFPTFFQRKKNFVDSLLDSQDSLLEVHKEDLLKFRDVIVQKALYDVLKANFSLVKVFNKHVRPDVRSLLKRNLKLMKNEFNNILHNGEAISTDFSHQSLLVLGRRGSGKSKLIENMFGVVNEEETVDYELRISEKVVTLQKDDSLRIQISHPRNDECFNFSFGLAAKLLAKQRAELRNNEKYLKLSKVVSETNQPQNRRNRRRQQLSFYQYPEGQSRPHKNGLSQRSQRNKQQNGNSLLHSYRNRSRKRGTKKKTSRSSYHLDKPLEEKRVSFERREKQAVKTEKMRPNMKKSEIVDSFDPKIVATYGQTQEKMKVFVNILEVSARISNSVSLPNKQSEHQGMPIDESGRKKLSEAEKFGRINKSMIDLNHLCFGLTSETGVLVLTFSIPKLLKYIQVEEERMILHNPITAFLAHNIRIAYSKSKSLSLFLVGTGYEESEVSEKALAAIQLIIQSNVAIKDFKRLIRYKKNKTMLCFHPVNNFIDNTTRDFKNEVVKRLFKNAKNRVKEKLYVKFLRAYDILKQEGIPFVSKQDIIELVEDANIKEESIDELLEFLKNNNLILHYPSIDILSNFIILDKVYFYQLMYQFVNRRYITKILNNKDIKEEAKLNELGKDLLLFKSKKLISNDLIEFVWTHNPNYDVQLGKATYLYLIEILKKSLFLTPWQNIRYNVSSLSDLVKPIDSKNIQEFTTENLFLLTACIKKSNRGNQTKKSRIRNVKSFAESSSISRKGRKKSKRIGRSYTSVTKESFDNSKLYARSRGGGSFEGALFSSRARRDTNVDVRGRLSIERGLNNSNRENNRGRSQRGRRNRNGMQDEDRTLPKSKKKKKKVIAINSSPKSAKRSKRKSETGAELSSKERAYEKTLAQAMKMKQGTLKPKARYLLNKNKPVSIIIDFQTSFLPTGLFFRLSSALYSLVIRAIQNEDRGFKKGIEGVELHQNLFRIKFDRFMATCDDFISDNSTHGGVSLCESEVEEVSVSGAKKLGESVDSKFEEKEYIALYQDEMKSSIIMVVRDHDLAPKYLRLLDSALELILPRKEDSGDVNEYMTMFYNVQLSKRMVKVEVKNNKFITLEVAERRKFAPWFAKNKRISSAS